MNKVLIVIIVLILLIIGWAFIRGSEDTWICQDGEWVKHGLPNASKPIEPCYK